MKKSIAILTFFANTLLSCKEETKFTTSKIPSRKEPKTISYTFQDSKKWLKENKDNTEILDVVMAVNRTDKANLKTLDSIIVPIDITGDKVFYLPFPLQIVALDAIDKIIFFSYPSQTFATYENGILIRTGPTNMGKKQSPTPTGLFFTNWKAKETISTVDDEWKLLWNFNVDNKEGIGFHEYSLPGYPDSHSCMRLQEKDAKYLYEWADQWVLADAENVKIKGTPVIIFGSYDFDAPKPWLKLIEDPKALAISEVEIEKTTKPYLKTILEEQKKSKNNKNM